MRGLLKTTLFLRDWSLFGAVNEVYGRYFDSETRGVRSTLKAENLPGPELVAIEAIATMNEKEIIATPGMKARRPGVASCVRTGDLIFLGGAVGNYNWDTPDWKYGPDIESQTKRMMENLEQRLEACGVSTSQLVHVLLMLNDRAELAAFEQIYRTHFEPKMLPARTTFEHPSSGPIFNELVEIYAIATRGSKEAISPQGIVPSGASSPVVRAGDFLFLSGMTGQNEEGRVAPDVGSQTRQTLENIRTCLEAAGSALSKMVKVLVFLTDIKNLKATTDACRTYLGDVPLPTFTAVQMNGPSDPELVMIEAVAVR